MFDTLFDLDAFWQLLVFCALSAIMLAISFLWLGLLNRRFALNPKLLPVGPAFVPVTTVFALFLGFLAVDVWNQQRQATDAALKERAAWVRLTDLASADALNMPAGAPMLLRYRKAIAQEWDTASNRVENPEASEALRELRLATGALSRQGAPAALVSQWLRAVDELEEARLRRLLIGADHTDDNQWSVVLVLAFFVYFMIAAAHLDKPPAGRLILVLFALSTTVAFWQLSMHTNPYKGALSRNGMLAPGVSPLVIPKP
ncbi:hypothetical protein [Variovorax terrae]|uniref:DUF4239 domain-containing protein n=1 Tax=Variovorax terrae TaxID=2923278 RepID=A0A9X1VU03_9BURK|nr:hypothetical protein [Variovorax terrae]MCJ0763302.1 hypothetical protein [Variovorax terrae]